MQPIPSSPLPQGSDLIPHRGLHGCAFIFEATTSLERRKMYAPSVDTRRAAPNLRRMERRNYLQCGRAGWGIHALNQHPHLPRLITNQRGGTSSEHFNIVDTWPFAGGRALRHLSGSRMVGLRAQARRQIHTALYPWSRFFVPEGSVTKDVAESTIP